MTAEPSGASNAEWAGLLERIAARDREAFAALFDYFAPRIKTYMQRSGCPEAQAEELAQDAMLTVWRKATLFDPKTAGAAAWIFTIARNLRIDAFRRQRREGTVDAFDVEIEFQVDEALRPDASLSALQSQDRVRLALAQLSDEQAKVIELSFFQEKAHGEIASILEIPLGTGLAMSRLRKLLGDEA
jgi:RNA polymerase sigma-70 factor (ECF subfamily)